MRRIAARLAWVLAAGGAAGWAGPAAAQGIDCSKARSPAEKAICASPALMALDRQSAISYADALARQPEGRDAMRQDLIRWLRERDTACALPAAQVPDCLRRQITRRIAALAPPATAAATPAPPTTAAPGPAPSPAPSAAPSLAPSLAASLATITDPAPRPLPDPAIPPAAFNPPAPAATLDAATVPAAETAETLLRVTSPGRFAVTAKSPSGAALQLVDMLAGPGETSGAAGSQDGRVDALLDVGTYKLRVMSAKDATGTVALTVTAFHDAAPARALPPPGQTLEATLRDGEQRAFWFAVPAAGDTVRIEAAGRSLADLRLWRNGRDLVDMDPATTSIEPRQGHGLTDLRLSGKLEPGTYLAVAYGGAPIPWTDNDAAQPFLLRAGASPALEAGWAGGTMGPFGNEVYALPPATSLLRLHLPAPAHAELIAGETATIERTSREPVATLAVTPGRQPVVEVRAAAGQTFSLRPLDQPGSAVTRPGTYWISAVVNGAGGDEVPPTVLVLNRGNTNRPARIVADTLPHLSPGNAWRARFNLRGPTTLLAASEGGPAALRTTGVAVQGDVLGVADIPAGFYTIRLQPEQGARGALEMILGAPGVSPPPPSPYPADPSIPLGTQTVAAGERLSIQGVVAPGVSVRLGARPSPVALAEGPLSLSLLAGAGTAVPVRIAPGGVLRVSEVGVGAVPYARQEADGGRVIVTLPPADHPRTVVLAWQRAPAAPAAIPAPTAPDAAAGRVTAGTPVFFDLQQDESRSFGLQVPAGGLLRVETLGRLHTAGQLATPFLPRLGQADANGIGENMLLQRMLRAGRYRVTVTAKDSAGHLGLSATPAPLLDGGTLRVGGTARASLPAGTGAAFPVLVDAAATVRFEVLSLGEPWQGRLEDADGWPVTAPGKLDGIERRLPPGRYRLLVEPAAVPRQTVLRLSPVLPPAAAAAGHGPHALPFDAPRQATWREPEGQNAERVPDTWTFSLAGSADVTLTLSEAMVGALRKDGSPDGRPDGRQDETRVTKTWSGRLEAGTYRLDVRALGRNDRAAYTVGLSSKQLQPGAPRTVSLPATLPFAVADARVVTLASFGAVPVKAVLRRADGTVVGRYRGRADDWNIAVSRPLPPGAYTLDLAAADTPDTSSVAARDPVPAASSRSDGSSEGESSEGDDNAAPADDQDAQTPASQQTRRTAAAKPATGGDAASSGSTGNTDGAGSTDAPDSGETPAPTVQVTLSLPAASPPVAAPDRTADLAGAGVRVLTLPTPGAGALLTVAARSAAPLVLSLERQDGAAWTVVALDTGSIPVVSAPGGASSGVSDGASGAWRAQVWTADGGPDTIQAAARVLALAPQEPGRMTLAAVDDMPAPLAAAHIRLPAPGLLHLDGAPDALLAGGWPGHALSPLTGAAAVPQGRDVWLLASAPATLDATPLQPAPGEAIALTVPAGLVAALPPAAEGVRLWRATSGAGQPSLGPTMGFKPGAAVALAAPGVGLPLLAADGEDLRVTVRQDAPTLQPAQAVTAALHATVPPGAALPVTLPPGAKSVDIALAPDMAAIPGWQDGPGRGARSAAWSGNASGVQTLTGEWTTMLLVNAGTEPGSVSLSLAPAPTVPTLTPGVIVKRFFGAAGSFELTAEGTPGARLRVAGAATLAAIAADGTVGSTLSPAGAPAGSATGAGGAIPLSGPGRVVVTHGVGAVAVWMETDAASPWPEVGVTPAALPSRTALSGPAMRLAVRADTPVLLRATTTAPVLLGLHQPDSQPPGRHDAPTLFASGAELNRILPAGSGELSVFSATDGPLSGTLDLRAEPVLPVSEGLGPVVVVPPGGAAAFGFTLPKAATIGIGVRVAPDGGATARLLDENGKVMGEGVAQLVALPPGRYVLEAAVPPGAAAASIRPAVIGIAPRPAGPPPDVVRDYLELAGMKPQGKAQ